MGKVVKVVNADGVPFNVRLVEKGDKYGLDWGITHTEDEPLVEFYDDRQDKTKFTEYGQFVTRYYLKTLKERDTTSGKGNKGLSLDLGVPDWQITGDNLEEILNTFK